MKKNCDRIDFDFIEETACDTIEDIGFKSFPINGFRLAKIFENFVKQIQYVDCLYIEDDRSKSENPIYQAFSRSQQQKLVQKFLDRNICVKLMSV